MEKPLPKTIAAFYLTIGIPLLYLATLYAIGLAGTIQLPIAVRLGGLCMCVVGLVFWVVSYFQLGTAFGVLPRVQIRIRSGLYRRFKHPMYFGILMTFYGLATANQSIAGLLTTALVMTPVLVFRAHKEEKLLVHRPDSR